GLALIGRLYLAIRRWLSSHFVCRKCGKTYHLMTFGYGTCICPDCFEGENPIVFFEDPIMRRLFR
ncbi:MAG: hypothetical protein ACFFDT_34865, partial [Candidatus Hodarchaeota archaeon]